MGFHFKTWWFNGNETAQHDNFIGFKQEKIVQVAQNHETSSNHILVANNPICLMVKRKTIRKVDPVISGIRDPLGFQASYFGGEMLDINQDKPRLQTAWSHMANIGIQQELVGGIPTPLKNMFWSVGETIMMIIPYIMEKSSKCSKPPSIWNIFHGDISNPSPADDENKVISTSHCMAAIASELKITPNGRDGLWQDISATKCHTYVDRHVKTLSHLSLYPSSNHPQMVVVIVVYCIFFAWLVTPKKMQKSFKSTLFQASTLTNFGIASTQWCPGKIDGSHHLSKKISISKKKSISISSDHHLPIKVVKNGHVRPIIGSDTLW